MPDWYAFPGEPSRSQVKLEMIRVRKHLFGTCGKSCPCDYCQKQPGTDMHEWISRARTMGNDVARELSFSPYICSIVCQYCHVVTAIVTTYSGLEILMRRNIEIYGYEKVSTAFFAMPATYRRGISLPDML